MVTQRDIADKLGVSVALVSRVVTGTAAEIGIPEDTIERVRTTMRNMGYVPNPNARALRGGNTMTLGVAVTSFTDPFLGPILGELETLATKQDLSLVVEGISQSDNATLGAALSKHVVDGLVVVGHALHFDWLQSFIDRDVPIAAIGHCPPTPGVTPCWIDERQGFSLLVNHLAECGTTTVGFIGGNQPVHRERAAVVRELIEAHPALSTRDEWFAFSEGRGMSAGHDSLTRIVQQTERPQAILGASDLRAIGALRAAHEAGLSIPRDLRLTGFDDLEWARLTVPSLTTVHVPRMPIVQAAFNHVINKAPAPAAFAPTLCIRETT